MGMRDDTGTEHPIPRARLRAPEGDGQGLSDLLGWLSLGLGMAQIAAPGAMNRLVGADDHEANCKLMRGLGFRELATGVGILTQPDPGSWVKARVAGDVLDLALLGAALRSPAADRRRLGAAAAAVAGVTALDVFCSARLAATQPARQRAVHVARSITIKRPPEEVHAFWRDFQNFPRFMAHLEEVRVLEGGRSLWRAKAPAGMHVTWEAETVEDRPGESIGWTSVAGATVPNWGRVTFRPAPRNRGTEVQVELHYEPPAGQLGRWVAKLLGEEPARQVADDLHRLKQVLEVGEVVRSDASPEGRRRSFLAQAPARPAPGGAR